VDSWCYQTHELLVLSHSLCPMLSNHSIGSNAVTVGVRSSGGGCSLLQGRDRSESSKLRSSVFERSYRKILRVTVSREAHFRQTSRLTLEASACRLAASLSRLGVRSRFSLPLLPLPTQAHAPNVDRGAPRHCSHTGHSSRNWRHS